MREIRPRPPERRQARFPSFEYRSGDISRHVPRRRRSAQLLRPAAGHGCAPLRRAAASARAGPIRAAQRIAGIGYATPYLGLFREEAERCLAFMPAAQGVVKWPSARADADRAGRGARSAAAGCGGRPRAAGACAGDVAATPRRCCARCGACWRPGGRLLAVIPNRRGVWARTDTTPFGHGRPYSRSQITALLRETWFTPTGWGEALYVPPIARALVPALGGRLGAHRRDDLGAVRGRAYRRGDQAGLSRDPGAARAAPAGAGAGAGAGAVAPAARRASG